MRRLWILARRASSSGAYLVSHQGLHGTYGNSILNRPLLGEQEMFPSPGDLRRPARLAESTLRSPRVSSLHNVIAERGCSGEGDQTPLCVPVEAHLKSRARGG